MITNARNVVEHTHNVIEQHNITQTLRRYTLVSNVTDQHMHYNVRCIPNFVGYHIIVQHNSLSR